MMLESSRRFVLVLAVLSLPASRSAGAAQAPDPVTAIVGVTLIDGNGGPPVQDVTILIRQKRIAEIGPRASVEVPEGAQTIDGAGKYATPGFIDTNVHVTPLSDQTTFARYWDRLDEVTIQGAQLQLKYGVTTIRDSYGPLPPQIKARDAIARGEVVGPRMYVAGNIVGWGGPYSETFSHTSESGLNLFEEQMNDLFTQGTGEELLHMTLDELRVAINKYLDKGVDFIKYGGTSHSGYPALITFSPRAQKVIVDETHKRGLVAETHSGTVEGLRLSILAGIDLIQHPRSLGRSEMTDELLELIVERGVICSGLSNTITGKVWEEHVEKREKALKAQAEADAERRTPKSEAEIRREEDDAGIVLEMKRLNAKKLIEAGCIISVGTDNTVSRAPEFRREEKSEHQDPGIGTLIAIEGLVELGMSPSDAIVAATKNGALACKALDEFGTLEEGKLADILLLAADPLADIENIRKLETVMKEGQIIDFKSLPTVRPYGEW